jgi:hypothetical protein
MKAGNRNSLRKEVKKYEVLNIVQTLKKTSISLTLSYSTVFFHDS